MSHPRVQPPARTAPAGNSLDWPAVLAEHRRWLRTIVLARLGDPALAEEVLQEVSLAAVKDGPRLADPRKAAPWLYRVAVRQCLLCRRRLGRGRKLTENFARQVRPREADPAPDPLGWLLADERRQQIRAALRRLAPRDAEMLLLKYTEDWSYHQLAEHLGISHSAVESRLHRARARLRQELAALEVVEMSR